MKISGQKIFWGTYWKIYRSLAAVRPYKKTVDRGINLLEVKDGGRYLDLACGPGITSRKLKDAGRNLSVLGIDSSKSGLAIARADNPDIHFAVADFNMPLPIKSRSMDGVFANNAFYLVKDPVTTLGRIRDILRPGGMFVMSTPKEGARPFAIVREHLKGSRGIFEPFRVFAMFLAFLPFQIALKGSAGGAANFWSQEKWEAVLEDARLKGIEFEVVAAEPSYADQNTTFALRRT
ncbi:MAG: class I SAM-dependent methyltransferase [Candidatus Margulisiibacteriota bacterium]|nr:class I SAM-dependent methyltransferase [Candidatus Margulisiibacteriota bacterium]